MSTDTLTISKQTVAEPPLFNVLLLNDDYTPTDFVVSILESVFHKSPVEANLIMREAHQQGMSIAGTYPFEIAETKVQQVRLAAQQAKHPLRCDLEPG